jgi:hypothetical protein
MQDKMRAEEGVRIKKFRARARAMKRRMDEIGVSLSLQQAYEAVAAEEGCRSWAALAREPIKSNHLNGPKLVPEVDSPLTRIVKVVDALDAARVSAQQQAASLIDDNEGGLHLCILHPDPRIRMKAVHRLAARLSLFVSALKQGPLTQYKVLTADSADFAARYSNSLPGHGTLIEGLEHLENPPTPELASDVAVYLAALRAMMLRSVPGAVIMIGLASPDRLPKELDNLDIAFVDAKDVLDAVEERHYGLCGSTTPGKHVETNDRFPLMLDFQEPLS